MKQLLSVIMAVVLIGAVGGAVAGGTFGGVPVEGFNDTEMSTDNYMCAGSRILELSGGPIVVENAWPCEWYEEEYLLINAGTLEGVATIHIPKTDNCCGGWHGIKCCESGTMKGLVYDGEGYRLPVSCEPKGSGVATSEPELATEEGGIVGEDANGNPVYVPGLGVDKCDVSKYIDVIIWFDKNGDGDYDDSGEKIVQGKLADIACTEYDLGKIPQASGYNYCTYCGWHKQTGWGCYFKYHVNSQTMEVPLMAAKALNIGTVSIWNDATNLYVRYDTTSSGWKMTETHIYAGKNPPPKMAPGQFPYGDDHLNKVTTYLETIPLAGINGGVVPCNDIYIAAHAVVAKSSYCKCYEETAWGCGEGRRLKLELHFQDVDEDDLCLHYFDESIPAEAKWDHWPTDAYMGDQCTFDLVFKFKKSCTYYGW